MEGREKLTEEQKQMVEDNLGLVTYIAKKYFTNDYVKNQDIIQEGIYAMIKAIPKYDSEKAKFSTYMYPTIDGHLKRFARYQDRIIPIPHQKHLKEETMIKADIAKFVLSLDLKYSNSDGDDNYTLVNLLPSEVNVEYEASNNLDLDDAIKSLEWREKIIIIYRFYFDLNQTFIGKLLGISQAHTHRCEKKALDKIRRHLVG